MNEKIVKTAVLEKTRYIVADEIYSYEILPMCYYNGIPRLPIADSICSLTRATTPGAQPAQIERCTMEGRLPDFRTSMFLLERVTRPLLFHYTA